jgi:hypothetical protein
MQKGWLRDEDKSDSQPRRVLTPIYIPAKPPATQYKNETSRESLGTAIGAVAAGAAIGAAAWALSRFLRIGDETAVTGSRASLTQELLKLAPQLMESRQLRAAPLDRGEIPPSGTILEVALFASQARAGATIQADPFEARPADNASPLRMIFHLWMKILH